VESLLVPAIVGHVQFLKQSLLYAREGFEDGRIRAVHRHRRVVVIKRSLKPERADGRTKSPSEMSQPLYKVGRKPEVVCAELPVVLSFAESGVGKRLPIGVDQLVLLELVVG